jgi:hypothetical protein
MLTALLSAFTKPTLRKNQKRETRFTEGGDLFL